MKFLTVRARLSQNYCELVKIVLDNSQNFGIILHTLRQENLVGMLRL